MTNDLYEIHERIKFCREEIKILEGDVDKFLSSAIKIKKERKNHYHFYDIFVTQTKPIPVSLKSKSGSIANELRSCLDSLACTLANRNSKHSKNVYFPISKNKDIFYDDGLRKIKKLSEKDKEKIISLKPYRGGHPILFGIHDADRIRKHQRLVTVVSENTSMKIGNFIEMSGRNTIIYNCNIGGAYFDKFIYKPQYEYIKNIGEERAVAHNVPLSAKYSLAFAIVYLEPPDLHGKDVSKTLAAFSDTVESIAAMFDGT